MAESFARRSDATSGKDFLTHTTTAGLHIQPTIPVDAEGVVTPAATEVTLAAVKAQFDSMFSRILEKRFLATEEVRYDIPASLISADLYTGVAADATATSAASWAIVRFYFDAAGNPARARFRSGVAWTDRASGWS